MARALVTKTSLTFGVASVDMRNLHFAETCSGLQTAAREGGYHLVVTELDFDDDRGIGTLETLVTLGVDGIVLFPSMLSGFDLEVRSGEVIAIVGRTGTGKSTLMDLLLRFHEPTAGSIEIDGTDLRDLQRNSFLDHVAVVTQEPFLFDETIAENIRYGRHDASDKEIREAAKAAGQAKAREAAKATEQAKAREAAKAAEQAKARAAALGGYDCAGLGAIVYNAP